MTHYADTFETGNLTNWPTVTGNAAANAAAAYTGSYGLRLAPGGGVASQVATSTSKWAQGSLTWAFLRLRFRFNSLPVGTTADIATLQCATQLDNFDFFYNNTTGTFWFDLQGATAFRDTGIVPTLGRWYDLQALVFYGATTYTAEVLVDGQTTGGVLSSPGEPSSTVRSLHLGTSSTAKTFSLDIDNVVVNVGTSAPAFEEYRTMAKQSGLGDRLLIDGFNLSGDIGSLSRIGGSQATQDVTGIDKAAFERLGLVRDGSIEFSGFFNDAAGQAHPVLAALPTADRVVSYFRGFALGGEAACLVGKQIDYSFTRGNDGALTIASSAQANGFGLEWGVQGTPGIRTDGAASNGASVDGGAATAWGLQAYLQVLAFTGTSVTVKLQESSDAGVGDAWTDVVGGAFTAATARGSQRIETSRTLAVERYLRVVTTGTFSNAQFAVVICRNVVDTRF